MMKLMEVKKALRNGKYAWPGGYPLYFVMTDGEALSFEAARKNWHNIVEAHLHNDRRSGWAVEGVDTNWEDEALYCAHTGVLIECAYPSKVGG